MTTSKLDAKSRIILELGRDPVLAHKFLFSHRWPQGYCPAHEDLIRVMHSDEQHVEVEGFRGFGKSTIAEEAQIIRALYRRFRNCLVISATETLAQEHLASIATELLSNERIALLFGDQIGEEWSASKIVLANGVALQAISKGQKLRGTRHKQHRPDEVYGDDIEDDEDVREPKARARVEQWFFRKLLPAMVAPARRRTRIIGTRLDVDSLLAKCERAGWVACCYPIKYLDAAGTWRPLWPDLFPMAEVAKLEHQAQVRGAYRDFLMEYMCIVERPEDKPFRDEQFRIEPHVRTWQCVYHMWDPARTVGANSATTGFASWSWMGPKLVIWEAYGRKLMPDELVKGIFDEADRGNPTLIGVEEDGLNEWLMQPIRQEAVRRGAALPIIPVRAPRGKIDFIRALQPFFQAREVDFAKDLPDLKAQLKSFPSGVIDVPNALAYALKLRPGAPMYEDFGARNVAEELGIHPAEPVYLCVNATRSLVTGVLVQVIDGAIRVHADYVREGEAAAVLRDIVALATLESGKRVYLVCGSSHFDPHHNFGLVQACRALPADPRRAGAPETGRPYIRSTLQREHRHMPMLLVSGRARWTANAFAGGYARALLKGGVVADYADEGQYRVLMEGLECFCGLLNLGAVGSEDNSGHYATTRDGRSYLSAARTR